MFTSNTSSQRSRTMQPTFRIVEAPSHSAIAATVTTLVSAWFLVAGATMVASPTDTQVASHARVTVTRGATIAEPPAVSAQATPDAHFTIVVEARRA
jgi:hypothetical protein